MAKYLALAVTSALSLSACKQQLTCGSTPKIVNGAPVKNSGAEPEIPSVVAVLQSNGSTCTGVLVGPRHVITAAHCIPGAQGQSVAFGQNRFNAKRIPIVKAVGNPLASNRSNYNDVGVILLNADAPAGFKPAIVAGTSFSLQPQDSILIAGYGESNNRVDSGYLLKTTIPYLSEQYGILFLNAMNGTGACRGDSGGPAYYKAGAERILVGLTQGGDHNCGRELNRYTDVRKHISWIESNLGVILNKSEKRDGSDIVHPTASASSSTTTQASANESTGSSASDPSICRI